MRSGIDCKSEQDFKSIIKRLKLCLETQVPQAQVPRNKWQTNGGEPRNTGGPPSWVAHITQSHIKKSKKNKWKTLLEDEVKHKNSRKLLESKKSFFYLFALFHFFAWCLQKVIVCDVTKGTNTTPYLVTTFWIIYWLVMFLILRYEINKVEKKINDRSSKILVLARS